MAGVKTLADGRTRLAILTVKPTNPAAPTVSELNGGVQASCLVAKNGTRISATGSDSVNDPELCSSSNAVVWGASNYEGTITPYWQLDATTGAYVSGDNDAYEALTPKGTQAWLYFREGPAYDTAWATGQYVDGYEVLTDNPQKPTETGAFIKRTIPLAIQAAYEHVTVGGAAVPVITNATPSGAAVGAMIQLTGSFFTGTTAITVDGVSVVEWEVTSDTKLALLIPVGVSGAAAIIVTNAAGASSAYSYTAA